MHKPESARVLPDHSIRFLGDAPSSEATLHFEFKGRKRIEHVKVEILPRSSADRRLGRGEVAPWLFDIKPSRVQANTWTSLDWKEVRSPQAPTSETLPNVIDYLTDTGWRVPPLANQQESFELYLRLDDPLTLDAGESLALTLDSGGGPNLGALARVRVSFPTTTIQPSPRWAPQRLRTTPSKPRGGETRGGETHDKE